MRLSSVYQQEFPILLITLAAADRHAGPTTTQHALLARGIRHVCGIALSTTPISHIATHSPHKHNQTHNSPSVALCVVLLCTHTQKATCHTHANGDTHSTDTRRSRQFSVRTTVLGRAVVSARRIAIRVGRRHKHHAAAAAGHTRDVHGVAMRCGPVSPPFSRRRRVVRTQSQRERKRESVYK